MAVNEQQLNMSIDVFESSIVLSRYQDKTVSRCMISNSDVVKMFSQGLKSRQEWFDVEPNVVRCGIDGDMVHQYLVTRPAQMTTITVEVKRKYKFRMRMPNLLGHLSVKVENGRRKLESIKAVYAYSGRLTDKTILYIPPTPNIYTDGRICNGTVKIDGFETLSEAFEKAFIQSMFGDHLTDSALDPAAAKKNKWRNIIHALKRTKSKINLSHLRKVGRYGEIFN
jgi:hypothetical protein